MKPLSVYRPFVRRRVHRRVLEMASVGELSKINDECCNRYVYNNKCFDFPRFGWNYIWEYLKYIFATFDSISLSWTHFIDMVELKFYFKILSPQISFVIAHPCLKLNRINLRHSWVFTYYALIWLQLLIDAFFLNTGLLYFPHYRCAIPWGFLSLLND